MFEKRPELVLLGLCVSMVAITAGVALYANLGWDPSSPVSIFELSKDTPPRDTLPAPDQPPVDHHEGTEPALAPHPIKVLDPEEPGTGTGEAPDITIDELETLAELEGLQDFSNSTALSQASDSHPRSYTLGGIEDSFDLSLDGDASVREIEEADLVKVDGDLMYVLNPYRGLIIVDLSWPDNPRVLGNAPVLGNPVEMYLVGGKAYAIVTTDFGYWYSFARIMLWDVDMDWVVPYYRYQVGTQLVVFDVTDPTDPYISQEVGVEGFVTDSRRVGDVIYVVSNCYAWYNQYADTQMSDMTYVMSLNIARGRDIIVMDETTFAGRSNIIHVTTDHLFVSQWDRYDGERYGSSDITLVDISDPRGNIIVEDTFSVEGQVDDRYQLDEYEGVLRVVSHFRGRNQQSELWTFDLTYPWDVRQLGHIVIDDEGNLMATRFEGERGYTIHLPRSIDPLDVIDISDPRNPVVCDVFEMPGWVTHMEVRGLRIIAIGVDDSEGERNVAVSLFDVTDPWNVVMEDRVRLGGSYASSSANWDPKALTVLDDEGVVLVPFYTYGRDDNGDYYNYNGVQVVRFDLNGEDLFLGGSFEQPDQVTRTRSVNGRAVSTSTRFLQVVDIRDVSNPRIKSTIELCPDVQDHRVIDGYTVELVREYRTGILHLRTFHRGQCDLNVPAYDAKVSEDPATWFWEDEHLFVFSVEETVEDAFTGRVTTFDLALPWRPLRYEHTFSIWGDPDDYEYSQWPYIGSSYYNYYYDYYYYYREPYEAGSAVNNPVLLEGGRLAYFALGKLFLVELSKDGFTKLTSVRDMEVEGFKGLLASDTSVNVVCNERSSVVETINGRSRTRYYYHHSLTPVDVRGSYAPVVGSAVDVPGSPVGISGDGNHVYTTSYWYIPGTYTYIQTFNVVGIRDGEAFTEHVLNTTGKTISLVGDKAVLTQSGTVNGQTESGNNYTEKYTVARVLSLPHLEVEGVHVMMGDHYSFMLAGEDYLMLRPSGQAGVVVMDLAGGDVVFSHYTARTYCLRTYRGDGAIFMVSGTYGVNALDLPDRY